MRRREFILLLGGAAMAWPDAAYAQQPASKLYRIGILETVPSALNVANLEAFRKGLLELGYLEGKNYVIEYRSAEGFPERFPQLASELVRLPVDLIVTRGDASGAGGKRCHQQHPGGDGVDRRSGRGRSRREPRPSRRKHHGVELLQH